MADVDTPAPVARLEADETSTADDLLALLGIDTRNPPGETAGAVDWLEGRLEDLGLETRRHAVDPAKPNLLARLPGEREATLCLCGHLDTVPFDADGWDHDPLGERVPAADVVADPAADGDPSTDDDPTTAEGPSSDAIADGDRLYGRGATDMKGAVASMLAAVGAFVEAGETPPVTLLLAFVADEETGGDAGLDAVVDAGLIDADACVIGEPTGEPSRPSVAVADRGSIWFTMEATGVAAHGSRPMLGANAIDRLYAGVRTLRERFGARRLEIDVAVEPIVEESVEYYAATLGESAAEDLFRYPTINLGTIEGGDAINTVPASARAEIDVRLAPGVDTSTVLSAIRTCADECRGVELADVSWSVGSYEPVDGPVVEATTVAAETVTGGRVFRRSATGGGDAKTLRRAGVPTVEFALSTDTAHAVDEYTTTGILDANARVYATLPYAFADRLA